MARIQILELPMLHIGEASKTPFVLVIDQVETETELLADAGGNEIKRVSSAELTQREADQIAREMGAVSAILAACTLDIA